MRKISLLCLLALALPLAVFAQREFTPVHGNCMSDDVEVGTIGHRAGRLKLPTPKTDWNPEREYRQMVILMEFADSVFRYTDDAHAFYDSLFNERGCHTIYASCFPGNDASRRVMEKCGMTYDHFSEKELTYLGIERDLTYYAIHRKQDVILLNGPSSAGKSSIAKALLQLLLDCGTDAVILSLDDYMQMSANEPIWEDDVFAIMPHMCEDIVEALQDGKTVIIDHVITSARIYRALNNAVDGFQMKTRQREAERGDRYTGSAEASLQYLYPKTGYDLCVDSSEASPEALAEEIIGALS